MKSKSLGESSGVTPEESAVQRMPLGRSPILYWMARVRYARWALTGSSVWG